jgi:hypothetical protein
MDTHKTGRPRVAHDELVRELVGKGLTAKEAASLTGIKRSTLATRAEVLGLKFTKHSWKPTIPKESFDEFFGSGYRSLDEICEKFDLNYRSVQQYIKAYNLVIPKQARNVRRLAGGRTHAGKIPLVLEVAADVILHPELAYVDIGMARKCSREYVCQVAAHLRSLGVLKDEEYVDRVESHLRSLGALKDEGQPE